MARKNNTVIANNKAAYHEYTILETLDAGIVLKGTEVKSMRENSVHVKDAFVFVKKNEAWLKNLHVPIYKPANMLNHDPIRDRKLLLTERQINYLESKVKIKGLTITVLSLRFNDKGFIKVEIGLAKGKKLHDKRDALKRKDIERDMKRDIGRI